MDITMGNQQANLDLNWLACLIESEGSIGFQKQYVHYGKENRLKLTPQITITNSDIGILDKAMRIIKEILNASAYITKSHKNIKPVYDIRILGSQRVPKVLLPIYPYLVGEKRFKAQTVIKFIELCTLRWQERSRRMTTVKGKINWENSRMYSEEDYRYMQELLDKCRGSLRDYNPETKYFKINFVKI